MSDVPEPHIEAMNKAIDETDNFKFLLAILTEIAPCADMLRPMVKLAQKDLCRNSLRILALRVLPLDKILPRDCMSVIISFVPYCEVQRVSQFWRTLWHLDFWKRARFSLVQRKEARIRFQKYVQMEFPVAKHVVTVTKGDISVLDHPGLAEYNVLVAADTLEEALKMYHDGSDLLVVLVPGFYELDSIFFMGDSEHFRLTIKSAVPGQRVHITSDCPLGMWTRSTVCFEDVNLHITDDDCGYSFHPDWRTSGKKYALRVEGMAHLFLINCRLQVQHHGVLVAEAGQFYAANCIFKCRKKVAIHAQSPDCGVTVIGCHFVGHEQCIQSACQLEMVGNVFEANRHTVVWRQTFKENEALVRESKIEHNFWYDCDSDFDHQITVRHPKQMLPAFSESAVFGW